MAPWELSALGRPGAEGAREELRRIASAWRDYPGEYEDDPVLTFALADLVGYLVDDILLKVDRASMAVALEVRVPLLDHRIVEMGARLPTSAHRRRREGKRIPRDLLRRFLPQQLLERPKRGFTLPLVDWLRGPLRGRLLATLDGSKLEREGLFDPCRVKATVARFLAGDDGSARLVWTLMAFELWLEARRGKIEKGASVVEEDKSLYAHT